MRTVQIRKISVLLFLIVLFFIAASFTACDNNQVIDDKLPQEGVEGPKIPSPQEQPKLPEVPEYIAYAGSEAFVMDSGTETRPITIKSKPTQSIIDIEELELTEEIYSFDRADEMCAVFDKLFRENTDPRIARMMFLFDEAALPGFTFQYGVGIGGGWYYFDVYSIGKIELIIY